MTGGFLLGWIEHETFTRAVGDFAGGCSDCRFYCDALWALSFSFALQTVDETRWHNRRNA